MRATDYSLMQQEDHIEWTSYAIDASQTRRGLLCHNALIDDPALASPRTHVDQPKAMPQEEYQVALVRRKDGSGSNTHFLARFEEDGSVLLLPLTWNELLDQLREHSINSILAGQGNITRFGEVHVDFSTMQIRRGKQPVELRPQELELLRFLSQHPNMVFSRSALLNEVWGYNNYPFTRTVDAHVWRLRQKLESDPSHPMHFRTVRGLGYKFVP